MFTKGHTPPHKGKKMSPRGLQNVIDSHRRPNYKGKGKNHYNWKGGITGIRREASWEYQEFRDKILKRDKYKCVLCECDDKKKLRLDHIKPLVFFPELRLVEKNCRILCKFCDFKYGFNYNRDKHLYIKFKRKVTK